MTWQKMNESHPDGWYWVSKNNGDKWIAFAEPAWNDADFNFGCEEEDDVMVWPIEEPPQRVK